MVMARKRYKLIPSRDINNQKNPTIQFDQVHINWPETTKGDSFRCYLPLMTNSIKN